MWRARQSDLERVEATLVIYLALPEGRTQHRHILAQVFQRGLHRDAVGPLDSGAVTGTDPQPQSPGSKIVQRQGLLC